MPSHSGCLGVSAWQACSLLLSGYQKHKERVLKTLKRNLLDKYEEWVLLPISDLCPWQSKDYVNLYCEQYEHLKRVRPRGLKDSHTWWSIPSNVLTSYVLCLIHGRHKCGMQDQLEFCLKTAGKNLRISTKQLINHIYNFTWRAVILEN